MLFSIRDLISEAPPLVTVMPTNSATEAHCRMLQNDYSQLPVVDEHGKSLGNAVTYRSILNALHSVATTLDKLTVDGVMTRSREVRLDADLLTVLDDIQEESFLLIVDAERTLKGIVTTFDTTAHFRRYAEELMVVEDVETMVRESIRNLYTDDELAFEIKKVCDKSRVKLDAFRRALDKYLIKANRDAPELDDRLVGDAFASMADDTPKTFDKLSFNELAELLLRHPDCPRPTVRDGVRGLRKLLHGVRNTRNDLAHFRGGVEAQQRDALRYCSDWLSRHLPSPRVQPSPKPIVEPEPAISGSEQQSLAPSEETVEPDDSTYAGLAIFLQSQPADVRARILKFEEIEDVIHYKLPKSARTHRAWWANDPSNVQAAQWLDVGWRAQALNMAEERVTFIRIAEREEAYIHFFSAVLERLRSQPEFPLRSLSPQGVSWHVLAELPWVKPHSADLNAAFTRQKTLRVEVYLDTGNATQNKAGFDALFARKDIVESALGQLSWERMDDKRSCRIAAYTPAAISGEPVGLDHAADWVARHALEFYRVFKPEFERLLTDSSA